MSTQSSGDSATASPRCAVGLLTWNGGGAEVRCVASLLAQTEPNLEIRWIDNASIDGTPDRLRAAFSQSTSLPDSPAFPEPEILPSNTGFCGGHNIGFSTTRAPYYLALNQDAILAPDYIEKLCALMDGDPSIALASGLILLDTPESNPDHIIYSAGMAMGRGRFPFELGRGLPARDSHRATRHVPAVTGAAMLMRRASIEKLCLKSGEPFPPEFFAYFEEVDLALRAARAGMRCAIDGSALAWHGVAGEGGGGRTPAIRLHYIKNHWLMTLRNAGAGRLLCDLPAIIKGEFKHYLPMYARTPRLALRAFISAARLAPRARSEHRRFESMHPGGEAGLRAFFQSSRDLLRETNRDNTNRQDAKIAKAG